MGCPLYRGTIQRRLRNPEERHAIEIEGSLIEIAGGTDTATMTEDEDVTPPNISNVTRVTARSVPV